MLSLKRVVRVNHFETCNKLLCRHACHSLWMWRTEREGETVRAGKAFKQQSPDVFAHPAWWPCTPGWEGGGKMLYQNSTFSHYFFTSVFMKLQQQVVWLEQLVLSNLLTPINCHGDGTFSTCFLLTIYEVSSVSQALNNAIFSWPAFSHCVILQRAWAFYSPSGSSEGRQGFWFYI